MFLRNTCLSFFQSYFLSAPTLLWTWTCHCSSHIFLPFAQNSFLNIAVKNFWKPSKGIGGPHIFEILSRCCIEKLPCKSLYFMDKLSRIRYWWLIENANWPANGCITCWSLGKMVAKLNRSPAPKWQKRYWELDLGFAPVCNNAPVCRNNAARNFWPHEKPDLDPYQNIYKCFRSVISASFGPASRILVFTSVWGSL